MSWQPFLAAFGAILAILALVAPSLLSIREEVADLRAEVYQLREDVALLWCMQNREACREEHP